MREGEKEEGELLLPTLMSKTGGNWGGWGFVESTQGRIGGERKGVQKILIARV